MTVTSLLEAGDELVFARIVKVHADKEVPWAIGHVLCQQTLDTVVPKQSVFMNVVALRQGFQYFQVGPFKTPHSINLETYGLPQEGDIVVGKTGANAQGTVFTSWLPDRWARPIGYFFHYLRNTDQATRLYENKDPALRMVLLHRLTVPYGQVQDERLYDILILVLFDDTDALLEMCYKPQFRPVGKRQWNLMDKAQGRKIDQFCKNMNGTNTAIPDVPNFIEETAYLLSDSGICAHFRAVLSAEYDESKETFHRDVAKWLSDPTYLCSALIQTLIVQKEVAEC